MVREHLRWQGSSLCGTGPGHTLRKASRLLGDWGRWEPRVPCRDSVYVCKLTCVHRKPSYVQGAFLAALGGEQAAGQHVRSRRPTAVEVWLGAISLPSFLCIAVVVALPSCWHETLALSGWT